MQVIIQIFSRNNYSDRFKDYVVQTAECAEQIETMNASILYILQQGHSHKRNKQTSTTSFLHN